MAFSKASSTSTMNRSPGVTIAAVFSLLGSLLFLLLGFLLVVFAIFSRSILSSPAPPGGPAIMFLSASFMTLPGIWGLATSVGLFRLKRWARISILIFAALLTFFGLVTPLGLLAVRFPTPPNQDPAILNSVRWGMSAFYLCLAGVGVWWLIFFTRRSIKEQFLAKGQIAGEVASSSARPLSILVIASLFLLGSIGTLISALLRLPAVFFNQILTGWAATFIFLAYTAICIYLGIGLLRLDPRARLVAIAYSVFAMVSSILTYALPGAQQRLAFVMSALPRMFHGENSQHAPVISPWFTVGFSVLLMVVQIYFLVTRKQAFYRDVTADRVETSP
jgi:hypothetical protein